MVLTHLVTYYERSGNVCVRVVKHSQQYVEEMTSREP